MNTYREVWSRRTPWQWPAMTMPTVANFANHSSGLVRVAIDGDDIVLYRDSSEERFQSHDLLVNGGEENDVCRIDVAGDLGPQQRTGIRAARSNHEASTIVIAPFPLA